jgi:hypothetical protein
MSLNNKELADTSFISLNAPRHTKLSYIAKMCLLISRGLKLDPSFIEYEPQIQISENISDDGIARDAFIEARLTSIPYEKTSLHASLMHSVLLIAFRLATPSATMCGYSKQDTLITDSLVMIFNALQYIGKAPSTFYPVDKRNRFYQHVSRVFAQTASTEEHERAFANAFRTRAGHRDMKDELKDLTHLYELEPMSDSAYDPVTISLMNEDIHPHKPEYNALPVSIYALYGNMLVDEVIPPVSRKQITCKVRMHDRPQFNGTAAPILSLAPWYLHYIREVAARVEGTSLPLYSDHPEKGEMYGYANSIIDRKRFDALFNNSDNDIDNNNITSDIDKDPALARLHARRKVKLNIAMIKGSSTTYYKIPHYGFVSETGNMYRSRASLSPSYLNKRFKDDHFIRSELSVLTAIMQDRHLEGPGNVQALNTLVDRTVARHSPYEDPYLNDAMISWLNRLMDTLCTASEIHHIVNNYEAISDDIRALVTHYYNRVQIRPEDPEITSDDLMPRHYVNYMMSALTRGSAQIVDKHLSQFALEELENDDSVDTKTRKYLFSAVLPTLIATKNAHKTFNERNNRQQ